MKVRLLISGILLVILPVEHAAADAASERIGDPIAHLPAS
jgi:hypothetical protein